MLYGKSLIKILYCRKETRKEHHAQVLFKKGGNSVNETSGLELYVVKQKKRTMFYYYPNIKE